MTEQQTATASYDPNTILTVALDICEGMLECGAEIHRVEDTGERICRAYGAVRVEIFAMTSLILATIEMSDDRTFTQVRRVYGSANDLYKIEKLNGLSRLICSEKPDPTSLKEKIVAIRVKNSYPLWLRYVGGFLGAFGFAFFFGGGIFDALLGGLVGLVICLMDFNSPKQLNQIAYTVIMSAVGSLLITMAGRLFGDFIPLNLSVANISVVMLLIPGLALGNAVRDLLCGEIVSGSVKMLQCVLTAGAIATGFTGIMLLVGDSTVADSGEVAFIPIVIAGGLGTIGFSVLFGVPYKRIVFATLAGMLCTAVYEATINLPVDFSLPKIVIASVCGGFILTCYAEIMARIQKTPTTVFLIPGLIPLVPGRSLYYCMAYLVQRERELALGKALDTLYVCVGLAIGIVMATIIFQVFRPGRNGGRKGRIEGKEKLRRAKEMKTQKKEQQPLEKKA